MPQLDSYLIFDGNCAEAMGFYEKVLGAKRVMMMNHAEMPGGLPPGMPPEQAKRIMHARLDVGGRLLMGSDAMAGQPYEGMRNFYLSLVYPTVPEAKKVFEALAE